MDHHQKLGVIQNLRDGINKNKDAQLNCASFSCSIGKIEDFDYTRTKK